MSVNYGMVLEAERLGVALQVVEAGGYPNLARQIAQIRDCTGAGTDILVVGTVSFEGLTPTVLEIAERMPVTAVVNDIADPGITAKTGVSWTIMGSRIGEHLARRHPRGSAPVKVAWFPGPRRVGLGAVRRSRFSRSAAGELGRDRRDQVWGHRQGDSAHTARGGARGETRCGLHRRQRGDCRGGG